MENINCRSARQTIILTLGLQILYDKAGDAGLTSTQVFQAINYSKSLSNNMPVIFHWDLWEVMWKKELTFKNHYQQPVQRNCL